MLLEGCLVSLDLPWLMDLPFSPCTSCRKLSCCPRCWHSNAWHRNLCCWHMCVWKQCRDSLCPVRDRAEVHTHPAPEVRGFPTAGVLSALPPTPPLPISLGFLIATGNFVFSCSVLVFQDTVKTDKIFASASLIYPVTSFEE